MDLKTIERWIENAPLNLFPSLPQGAKLGKRATDYAAGTIKYEVVNPSGDWRNFVVRGEKQWYPGFDTMNCTGYANNNSAEIQLKYRMGIEFNFSDRALSVLAECTQTGNYLYKPADVGRNIGRILERDWPDDDGPPASWQDYNKPLTADVMKKVLRFHEEYEWVGVDRASLIYHLKQAPLQLIINNGTHSVVLVCVDDQGYWYFDSYDPYLKVTTAPPNAALKIVVKPMSNSYLIQLNKKDGTKEFALALPATNDETLIDKSLNVGYPLPTSADGKKVDWPNVQPRFVINE